MLSLPVNTPQKLAGIYNAAAAQQPDSFQKA